MKPLLTALLIALANVAYANGPTPVIVQSTGMCLTVLDASKAVWESLIQYSCNTGPNEVFDVEPIAPGSHTFTMKAMNSGLCADTVWRHNRAAVVQNTCSGTRSQQFTMKLMAKADTYQIVQVSSGQCLSVLNNLLTLNAPIMLAPCSTAPNMVWLIDPITPGRG